MLSFVSNLVTCLGSFLGFVCWQFGVYKWVPDRRLAKLVWQLPCHLVCTSYGLLHAEMHANENMMIAKPNDTHLHMSYAFYYGYWLSVVYDFVKNWDLKDKDHMIMIFHHISTFIALISSDWLGYRDVGLHVLLLHDGSDIFIMLLKILVKCSVGNVYVYIAYAICLCVWIYLRLWKFVWKLCIHLMWKYFIMDPFFSWKAIPAIALYTLSFFNLVWTKMLVHLMCKRKLIEYEGE